MRRTLNFKCGIIGAGRLGSVLAQALSKKMALKWIVLRSEKSRISVSKIIKTDVEIFSSIKKNLSLPDIIILTVGDSKIEQVAVQLANKFGKELRGKYVIHCSGVLPVSVLDSCRKAGAKTACCHPYQTFYESSPETLIDISWGVETRDTYYILENFVKALGGKPLKLSYKDRAEKALYHISAVFASNFLSTVVTGAELIASKAELPWKNFLPRIINTTIENNLKVSDKVLFPLTGPIVRGDVETLRLHINSLSKYPSLLNIYCYLSLATLETAKLNKLLTKQKFGEIKDFLVSYLFDKVKGKNL
jgi:predicted short-subunit dehydrogenase-like oxidoreductase (DUF2520 family)